MLARGMGVGIANEGREFFCDPSAVEANGVDTFLCFIVALFSTK